MERGIGQLKRRFHVLHGEIRVTPGKTSQIVMVCAASHNLSKERNLELPDEQGIGLEDHPDGPNQNQFVLGKLHLTILDIVHHMLSHS